MTTTEPTKPRFYTPTPGKLVLGLLIIELVLLLIKPTSGWMVLTGIAIFILTILVGLIWFGFALVLRKRFQFGISSLFGLMCVVAVVGGWFTWKMERATQQKEALEVVGAVVLYEGDIRKDDPFDIDTQPKHSSPTWLRNLVGIDFLADVTEVVMPVFGFDATDEWVEQHVACLTKLELLGLSNCKFTDRGLEHLKGLTRLECLSLHNTQVSDAGLRHLKGLAKLKNLCLRLTQVTNTGLEHIKGLTNLEVLQLGRTQVGDDGLEHLKGLANLKELSLDETQVGDCGLEHLKGLAKLEELLLDETQVGDDGMEHLKGLAKLEELSLDETQVSDDGLEHLKGLANLKWLHLDGTQVTDAGLEHLKGLATLQVLSLQHTLVTDEGIKELQEALPNCLIHH